MRNIGIILTLFIISICSVSAKDDSKFFSLIIPEVQVIPNSLYDKIEFLDSRSDYEFNELKIDEIAFASQLNSVLQKMTDQSAQDLNLFMQLRNLSLHKDKNKGDYAHLRISLYERNEGDYYLIKTLDTKIPLEKSNQYQDAVSKSIIYFISKNLKSLQLTPDTPVYSIEDVRNIDLFEKESLKVYNSKTFAEGLYLKYSDFKNQTPESREITTNFKKGELKEVKILRTDNGKERKLSPDNFFAVVVDGRPYIHNGKKYISVYKKDNELYFDDEISESNLGISPAFSVGIGSGGYRGAGFGIGIVTHSRKIPVTYKIDHLTGDFIISSVNSN